MSGKTILITGGSGFLGALTARRILRQSPGQKILLTDIVHHPRTAPLAEKVDSVSADLSHLRVCLGLLTPDTGAVYQNMILVLRAWNGLNSFDLMPPRRGASRDEPRKASSLNQFLSPTRDGIRGFTTNKEERR